LRGGEISKGNVRKTACILLKQQSLAARINNNGGQPKVEQAVVMQKF
jgi:hypothetical protein